MAENTVTLEGSIKGFLDKLRKVNAEYGLTKEESDAYNRDRLARATNVMLTALGGASSSLVPGALTNAMAANLAGMTTNAIRKSVFTDKINASENLDRIPDSVIRFVDTIPSIHHGERSGGLDGRINKDGNLEFFWREPSKMTRQDAKEMTEDGFTLYAPREMVNLANAYEKVQKAQKNPSKTLQSLPTDFMNTSFLKSLRKNM